MPKAKPNKLWGTLTGSATKTPSFEQGLADQTWPVHGSGKSRPPLLSASSINRHHEHNGRSSGNAEYAGYVKDVDSFTEKEVNVYFENVLKDLGIKQEAAAPMLKFDIQRKREFIKQQIQAQSKENRLSERPDDFLRELSWQDNTPTARNNLLKTLQTLYIALRTNSVTWMKQFGPRGLHKLVTILRQLSDVINPSHSTDLSQEKRAQLECLKCINVMVNTHYGCEELFKSPEAFNAIVGVINETNPETCITALNLLSATAILNYTEKNFEGHARVLQALTEVAENTQRERFGCIISCLYRLDHVPLQKAGLSLITAICGAPEDLDFRMHLRNEFMRSGLIDIYEELHNVDALKDQMSYFESQKMDDFSEFIARFETTAAEIE